MVCLHLLMISSFVHCKSSPISFPGLLVQYRHFDDVFLGSSLLVISLFFFLRITWGYDPLFTAAGVVDFSLQIYLDPLICLVKFQFCGFSHSCLFFITFIILQLLGLNSLTIYILFLLSKYNACVPYNLNLIYYWKCVDYWGFFFNCQGLYAIIF